MSSFRTRQIRQKSPARWLKKCKKGSFSVLRGVFGLLGKHKRYVVSLVLIVVATGIVFKVTSGVYSMVRNFDPKDVVFAVGKELKQDENGYVNILLLGDGGHERDGADLVDTIMVASIDLDRNLASLFSIPRDFYVRSNEYGNGKVNEFYRDYKKTLGEVAAYDIYPKVVGELVGLDIPYYARIDFNAFVEIIDSLGGVEVEVEKSIYDPYYPNDNDNGYTVFEIDAGLQLLDGENALKFVRSRKTTSDFDRAGRQQQVLMAIRNKALSKDILTSPKVIKDLYNSISANLNTNLTTREMIALAKFAKDFDRSHLVRKVIHDDPSQDGGFLYTPERKYYNGQFVLVPDGDNLDLIHRYTDLIFHQREVLMNPIKIEILNATKKPGLARVLMSHLNRFGFNVVNVDNLFDASGKSRTIQKSYIKYHHWEVDANKGVVPKHQVHLNALSTFTNGEIIPTDEPALDDSGVDVTIVLGADYEIN